MLAENDGSPILLTTLSGAVLEVTAAPNASSKKPKHRSYTLTTYSLIDHEQLSSMEITPGAHDQSFNTKNGWIYVTPTFFIANLEDIYALVRDIEPLAV